MKQTKPAYNGPMSTLKDWWKRHFSKKQRKVDNRVKRKEKS